MTPAEVIDRAALRDLVERYALAVDEVRSDDVAALFTADGVLVAPATPGGLTEPVERIGHGAIANAIASVARYDRTMHAIVGHIVDLDPKGQRATGTCTCIAHHVRRVGGDLTSVVWGLRYHDSYVREQGGWRFARRRLEVEWIEARPVRAVQSRTEGWQS